jgi:hypothetical protein
MQKMQKQSLDLEQKLAQWKLDTFGSLTPEEAKVAVGAAPKDPLATMQAKFLGALMNKYGINLDAEMGLAPQQSQQPTPSADIPESIAQGQMGNIGQAQTPMPAKSFDWQAPGAEELFDFALTNDPKNLVPPIDKVDLGDRIAIMRGRRIMGFIPKTTKKELKEYTDAEGNVRTFLYDSYRGAPVSPGAPSGQQGGTPGGMVGGGQPTTLGYEPPSLYGGVKEPSKTTLPQPLSDSASTKVSEINTQQAQLNWLVNNVKEEYLGAKGWIGETLDNYSGTLNGLGPIGQFVASSVENLTGVKVDPERATWRTLYHEFAGTKIKSRGGSAVTETELRFIMRTLPLVTQSKEIFEAVSTGMNMLLEVDKNQVLSTYLTPHKKQYEQTAANIMEKYRAEVKPVLDKAMKAYESSKSSSEKEAAELRKKLGL